MSLYPVSFLEDDRNVSETDARIDSPGVCVLGASPMDTSFDTDTDGADPDGASTGPWTSEQDTTADLAFYIDPQLTLDMHNTHPSVRHTLPGSEPVALEYTVPITPEIPTYVHADFPSYTASAAGPLQHTDTDTAPPTQKPFDPRDPYISFINAQGDQATESILGAFVCLPLEYFRDSEVFEIRIPESVQHNDSSSDRYRTARLNDDDVLLAGSCIPGSRPEGAEVFTSDAPSMAAQ